jgi:predicted Zn-ribbon and HTH transcriptional regulator
VSWEVVTPGPSKDYSRCTNHDCSKPVSPWFCHGELEYVRDGERYATRCKTCGEVRAFVDNDPDICPGCKIDLREGAWKIPQELWVAYGARQGTRRIGIYSRERDRTVAWRCPDCNHEWSRE